eukprot:184532-Hanusia_phi.AAC.2
MAFGLPPSEDEEEEKDKEAGGSEEEEEVERGGGKQKGKKGSRGPGKPAPVEVAEEEDDEETAELIAQLEGMGFARKACRWALKHTGGRGVRGEAGRGGREEDNVLYLRRRLRRCVGISGRRGDRRAGGQQGREARGGRNEEAQGKES